MKNKRSVMAVLAVILMTGSCSKLHEDAGGNLTPGQLTNNSATVLLRGVYRSLDFTFTSFLEIFALSEITTDASIVPTRGGNWDDNGNWRVLHRHRWDPNHLQTHDVFKNLGGVVFTATDLLKYNPTPQQRAEAKFLRAWAMYWLLDLYDQVPYREPGESVSQPAKVRKGIDALNYIISEINDVQGDLPDGPAGKANKSAATVLLMKCYLNKAVYINRATPSFATEDMNKVISLADDIIQGPINFYFSDKYFDNFSPQNASLSKENIFTQASNSGGNYALSLAWIAPLHYYQGGANGFTTLSKFYDKFQSTDKRREAVYTYPGSPTNLGNRVNVGFLVGPQYDLWSDAPLFDQPTIPVNFTPGVKQVEEGLNLNITGIRPIKYPPDHINFYSDMGPATNEFVYLRFPDVLLMKAEAILRGGNATNTGGYGNTALSIVNAIRTHPSRGATALISIDLEELFDERGRELWWENWRRQDMVRFGKFLLAFQEKNYESNPKYLMFPIPYEQLAVNPNLEQNPGY